MMRGGPGTASPGQIDYSNASLKQLVIRAYNLKPYQFSGPAWLDTVKFDIVARIPAATTQEQFEAMLQNLLVDRFSMTVRRETQEMTGYELSVAKSGLKAKEAQAEALPPAATPRTDDSKEPPRIKTQTASDGYRELAPGSAGMIMFGVPGGGSRYSARQQPISALVRLLEQPLGKPVVDQTGLTGKYDFNIVFLPDERTSANRFGNPGPSTAAVNPADSASEPLPDLFTALQTQVGLKLEQKKIPVDMVIVEKAERTPKEN